VAQRAAGGDAGVGDAHVDAAALAHNPLDRAADGIRVSDVAGRPHGIGEILGGALDAVGVEVEQRHAVGRREAARGFQADAARGARDDGDGTCHGEGSYEPGIRWWRAYS
jgi:hypothetical protein